MSRCRGLCRLVRDPSALGRSCGRAGLVQAMGEGAGPPSACTAAGSSGPSATQPQRPRPACRRGARRSGCPDLRQSGHQHGEIRTYAELTDESQRSPSGWPTWVAKGIVVIYMPMIPEAVMAMLACARIGAIHSVVFGGFASAELATRLDDAKPAAILSALAASKARASSPTSRCSTDDRIERA